MKARIRKRTVRSVAGAVGIALVSGALALGVSTPALADSVHYHYYDSGPHRHHDAGRHRSHGRFARRHAREKVIVHEHYYEPAPVVRHEHHHYGAAPRANAAPAYGAPYNASSLIGAAIGGLLGAQIGNGDGKLAATAAGTLGGLYVGDRFGRGYR